PLHCPALDLRHITSSPRARFRLVSALCVAGSVEMYGWYTFGPRILGWEEGRKGGEDVQGGLRTFKGVEKRARHVVVIYSSILLAVSAQSCSSVETRLRGTPRSAICVLGFRSKLCLLPSHYPLLFLRSIVIGSRYRGL
ncbi:hypothetical protein CSHISOI_05873, partial [Colletotrichum shisoi]